MEFNLLPHLLNTGFAIAEIGLFYGGEHLGAKITDLFLQYHFKMAIQYLPNWEWRRVKTLQILVVFFSCFIKTLDILRKGHADKF